MDRVREITNSGHWEHLFDLIEHSIYLYCLENTKNINKPSILNLGTRETAMVAWGGMCVHVCGVSVHGPSDKCNRRSKATNP